MIDVCAHRAPICLVEMDLSRLNGRTIDSICEFNFSHISRLLIFAHCLSPLGPLFSPEEVFSVKPPIIEELLPAVSQPGASEKQILPDF